MDPFVNPENSEEILQKIRSAENAEQVEALIHQYFPSWLVLSLEHYSQDYAYLEQNWHRVCRELNANPKKIVLVSDIKFDPEHSTINAIAEFMTRNGYVVRRANEFIACHICERALPCLEVWALCKEKNLPVPAQWQNKCSHH